MLECEALMALGLAGKHTRVVLAGDHMQIGPKLFSVKQDKCSEQTLLNRLFYYYQAENGDVAKQSRIIFNENYRSTKDIVDFVSTHFYVGKSDVIKARGYVPPHPHQHALQFHHVRGECCLDPTSMSWFNAEQILSVVDIVKNIGQAFPGDKVTVEILSEISNPPTGKVINILESADTVKEFERHRKYLFVVKVLKWRKFCHYPLGIAVGLFPEITSLDDGLNVLNIEFQLRRTLSSSVETQMQDFQSLNLFEDGRRRDFRMLPTFTIDPADSQDLDDAISVMDLGDCYEIGVHISDVASFLAKGSELDKYAKLLCTSFYPCGKEPIHMFPKELSANFFSLIPNHDRRAISLIIQVDTKTNCIKKRLVCKSVIHSKRKFSYDEAEDILENNRQHYDLLEMCLLKAWNFAEVHRKYRKQDDWCYKMPDEDVTLGRRRSHLMVEELMVMFNHTVAERLLSDETTRSLIHRTAMPNPQAEISDSETIPILKSVLRCLKTAAERLCHKACILRSNSTHVSRTGHYDLDLDSYTWASSPVRRYIDVIVQRLLHSVIDKTNVRYTAHDIDLSCIEFSRKNDQQSAYERKANALHFALKLSTQSEKKIDGYLPSGFSHLNNSQCKAIREALTNPFTLIQGPPGEKYFLTFFGPRLL
uniref:RNB domain-containing protein n=1 Tax=Sinocyclocheilus grahami TaxID=75366 RepID=A0A672MIN8_SINGR